MKYAKHFSTVATPQLEPVPGKPQVQNSTGGFVFEVDDWARLDRFLILGNEGGTYYASEKKLTVENAGCVLRCAKADGKRLVDRIVEISDSGRAPKNDPVVFALAIAAGQFNVSLQGMPSQKVSDLALKALNKVCRIGTHLFQFIEAVEQFRGHGRVLNRALREWYLEKSEKDLAWQLVKYQQRGGWSHRDVLRLCKPTERRPGANSALRWAVGKWNTDAPFTPEVILGLEYAKKEASAKEIAKLIRQFNLPREAVPTQHLGSPEVWGALLEKMPLTALVRNLGKMSAVGLLKPLSTANGTVIERLGDREHIKKSRLHPVAILLALKTYAAGHGDKGKLSWEPVPQIIDALNEAFHLAFANVEPTGKRWLLACDVSGSMASGCIAGTSLTPREATAALALVTARKEANCHVMGFSNEFVKIPISQGMRLDAAVAAVSGMPFAGTDCSLPMLWATQNGVDVDCFCVLTDNETWAGHVHPCQALRQYRQKTGIPAKLIVCGMTATNFSIADPADAGSMDVVGFDAAAPQVMADFAVG